MNNKTKSKLITAIILSLIVIAGLFFGLVQQTSFSSDDYVQSPTFYYYECSPAMERVSSVDVNLATGNSGGFITAPENADDWDLWISQTEETSWYSQDKRIVYQICHASGCDAQVYEVSKYFSPQDGLPSVHISNLLTTDKVYVNYQSTNFWRTWSDEPNGAKWYQTYKPFILWKVDMFGGGRNENTSIEQGCTFSSSDRNNLINYVTNSKKTIPKETSSSTRKLGFYETRNFIGTYVPLSTSNVNFVEYNGQKGYCLNRQIFAITTVDTYSDTLKIVDQNFNTRLADSVDCCPGEETSISYCNDNFEWVYLEDDLEDKECSLFNPCAGADWQTSGSKTLIRYNCIDNKCVAETKTVECTASSDCGNDQTCDTYLHECVDIGTGPVEPIDVDDLKEACKEKAISQPWMGWTYTETVNEPSAFKEIVTLGFADTKTTAKCKASFLGYYIFGGIFFILALIFIPKFMPKNKKRKCKK